MSGWLRLYDEALDDPKIQRLPPDEFKFWVNCLMLANRHDGILPEVCDIAFAFRMPENGVETLLERLINAGLIDVANGGRNGRHTTPHGWKKRQFKSDSSTERVRRHRKRECNVSETPRARSESETEQNREESVSNDTGRTVPPTAPAVDPPGRQVEAPSLNLIIQSPESGVYDLGKTILGKNAGGQITRLLKHFGGDPDRALICLKTAAAKSSPAEYIGAVLRGSNRYSATGYNPDNDPAYHGLDL